jgi:hypothetical protein
MQPWPSDTPHNQLPNMTENLIGSSLAEIGQKSTIHPRCRREEANSLVSGFNLSKTAQKVIRQANPYRKSLQLLRDLPSVAGPD